MTEKAILVGVDASPASQFAVAWATREAALRGIGLHIVHAADERAYGLWLAPDSVRRGLRELARPTMLRAKQLASSIDPSIDVSGQVIIGPPAEVLARRAANFDLVVVGKHSGATITHLPGSVPRRLIGDAIAPLVAVGPEPVDGHVAIDRVVVAVEAAQPNEPLTFAFEQARLLKVPLLAVHTWRVTAMPPLGMSVAQAHPAALSARSLEEVREAVEALRVSYPDVPVSIRNSEGAPSRVVPALCRPEDLLVIGHRKPQHGHLHHVGAVAAAALREAPCTVVVVPTSAPKVSAETTDHGELALH